LVYLFRPRMLFFFLTVPSIDLSQIGSDEDDTKLKGEGRFEEKYELTDEELGEGATAVVKVGKDKRGVEYAVKIMDRKNVCMDEEKFEEEISVLRRLKHPNIIRLYDVYKTKANIYIVTELATGGELFERLLDQNSFAEKDASKYTRKLFEAIKHMHEKGICHRDLKPENIMFKDNAKQSPLKIVDFGFASSLLDKKKKFRTMSQLGTMGYAAPEVFTGKAYTEKCDIWSLGVIVYILLCGYPPFVDMHDESKEDVENTPFWVYVNKMQTAVLGAEEGENPALEFPSKFWKHVSPAAKDFLKQILVVDPNKRPRASEALKHEWLAQEMSARGKHMNQTMLNMRKFRNIRKSHNTMVINQNNASKLDDMFKKLKIRKSRKKKTSLKIEGGKLVSSKK